MNPFLKGLEMEMASCGRSCGTDVRNDLAHLYGLTLFNCGGLQMVVRCNDPVTMVDFHAIAAAPSMPPDGPGHAPVG
ncbi:hypothetical protein GCM10009712_16810 [Pseudarthrobacter sulfonivorans]